MQPGKRANLARLSGFPALVPRLRRGPEDSGRAAQLTGARRMRVVAAQEADGFPSGRPPVSYGTVVAHRSPRTYDAEQAPPPRTPDRRVVCGTEMTLLLHHRPDGTVTAHARGYTGVGRSVVEALADLEREMQAVAPPAPAMGVAVRLS
jgi:hypothetical protein